MVELKRIKTSICGYAGPEDEFNPFVVTRQRNVPELLYLLHREPMSLKNLSTKLHLDMKAVDKLIADLARINAVRKEDEEYHINFATFDKEDIQLMVEKCGMFASDMADKIMELSGAIMDVAGRLSSSKQVDLGKILFALLGCFILDWAGLKMIDDEGLTLCGKKLQPGDRNYVLLGEEEVDREVEVKLKDRVYWGSHNSTADSYFFTSFGDHTGRRNAFPDFTWRREQVAEAFPSLQRLTGEELMLEAARHLKMINKEGPMELDRLMAKMEGGRLTQDIVNLLEGMGYVAYDGGVVKLNYPFFSIEDKEVVNEAYDVLKGILKEFTCKRFSAYREELKAITPLRRGFDFREIYTNVWHWIFGQANRILADRGFIYDPPRRRSGEARYIAWVSEFIFPD